MTYGDWDSDETWEIQGRAYEACLHYIVRNIEALSALGFDASTAREALARRELQREPE